MLSPVIIALLQLVPGPVRMGVAADHPRQPACSVEVMSSVAAKPFVRSPTQAERAPAVVEGQVGYVVWPLDATRVLVTRDYHWGDGHAPPATPEGRLLEVRCGEGVSTDFLPPRPGVDYGNAALTRDGKHLFFSGNRGVERVDLAQRAVRDVTRRPIESCTANPEFPLPPAQQRDIVVGFTARDARLMILRGRFCESVVCGGFWEGEPLDLTRPLSARVGEHRPHAFQSVDRAPHGTLWAVDGGLWRSTDGTAWERVILETKYGVAALVVTPNALVVLEGLWQADVWDMSGESPEDVGGALLRSVDGGQTWTRMKGPEGRVQAIEFIEGFLHARTEEAGWRLGDHGAWQPGPGPKGRHNRVVEVGGHRISATRDGLWRKALAGGEPVKLLPR